MKRLLARLFPPLPQPDPGDHPALRPLSTRELADLPFPRPGR